jgi:hypothetical protein
MESSTEDDETNQLKRIELVWPSKAKGPSGGAHGGLRVWLHADGETATLKLLFCKKGHIQADHHSDTTLGPRCQIK